MISRRSLLRGAAAAGFGLPWLESLHGRAHAQAAPPKRLVLFFTSCGTLYDEWKPTGTETSFTLSPLLQPLQPHQQDLVVIDGLDLQSAIDSPGDGHQPGIGSLWTGIPLLQGSQPGGGGAMAGWGGGPSVDQIVAQRLMHPTSLRSLELGIRSDATDNHGRMIYAAVDTPVTPQNSPQLAFDRMFGQLGGDPQGLAKLKARRLKVVDFVRTQLQAVKPKVSAADGMKLDQHLTSLSSLETTLQQQTVGPSCMAPAAPTAPMVPPGAPYWMLDAQVPLVAQQQLQLAVAALSCDVTRIVSVQFDHSQGDTTFSFLGHNEAHHDLSHSAPTDMPSRQKLRDINLWYAQRFADLLAMLKAVPEGSGTMLDNTLVVWGNELQDGRNHNHTHMPFVLAGRAGGAIQTGRFLTGSGPHNPLLVSVARAVGADVMQIGSTAYPAGPLPGL